MSFCEQSLSISFLTGSQFEGAVDLPRKCMHGFGCYTFPDGSTYRGYFRDGMLHGFGSLHLVLRPQKVKIKGVFKRGHLIEIADMIFGDGLYVNAALKAKGIIDFSEWTYCYSQDRRFLREIENGLKATTSDTTASRRTNAVDLMPGHYDTEEGIFNSTSGFTFVQDSTSQTSHFIPCFENIEWIKKYCRVGRAFGELEEPSEDNCQKIIENNLKCQKWANNNYGDYCTGTQKSGHKYFLKLYEMELEKAGETMKCARKMDENVTAADGGSTVSYSSFAVEKPRETELFDQVCGKSKTPYDYEGSVSVNMSLFKMIKVLYGGP